MFAISSLLMLLGSAFALEFDLQLPTKCIMEEMNAGVLALVEYSAFARDNEADLIPIQFKVEDPRGHVLTTKEDASGSFGFTTKLAGEFKVCFISQDALSGRRPQRPRRPLRAGDPQVPENDPTPQPRTDIRIRVDWKVGVAATDWDTIAKKENLNSMAAELRRLEEHVREIHDEMITLRKKEEQMRDLNEATNTRVATFSLISMLVCVLVGAWQLFYLRTFFIRKKLL